MAREPREPTALEVRQAELFLLPEEPALAVLVSKYVHNAKTTLKDEQRCFAVCELLMSGVGVERVAHRVNMSPHTVRAIRKELQDGGKLAGWKEGVTRGAKDFIADGVESLHQDLLAGRMTPSEKSVAVGILADKVRDWEGGPGLVVRVEHVQVVDAAYVEGLFDLVTEGQSGVSGAKGKQCSGLVGDGTGLGTGLGASRLIDAVLVEPPTALERGGGDHTFPAGGRHTDISDSGEFGTKGSLPPDVPDAPPTTGTPTP